MWRAVFYFLPAMVAYNASKKLDIDPWVGTAVILSLLTPNFLGLSNVNKFPATTCIQLVEGKDDLLQCTTQIDNVPLIGTLPLQLADYGGQVFVPLLMVPILALVYKWPEEGHPGERPDGVRPLPLLHDHHAAHRLPDRPPVDLDR